jgi:RNA polymerase primary sigma factor
VNRGRVPFVGEIGPRIRLSYDEERSLAVLARSGDKAARDKLILANLRLALAWAKKRSRARRLGDEMAYSVAAHRLIEAVDSFKPDHGGRLASYCQKVIRHALCRDLEQEDSRIHVPVYVRRAIDSGPDPDLTPVQLECLEAAKFAISQNCRGNVSEVGEVSDFLVNFPARSEPSHFGFSRGDLTEALDRLTPIHRAIILGRFPLDGGPRQTIHQLAHDLRVSTMTISRFQIVALASLRLYLLADAG